MILFWGICLSSIFFMIGDLFYLFDFFNFGEEFKFLVVNNFY